MTDTEVRRQQLLDRLESVMADAERYKDSAWDSGADDEAVLWFTIASAVRATIVMLNELDAP